MRPPAEYRVESRFRARCRAAYTFTSLANFLARHLLAVSAGVRRHRASSSRTPISVSSSRTSGGRCAGLTINAGLRYDLQWLPEPIQLDANNVSPRVGVAWAPGDGRTVVRASAGVYFDRIPLRATSNALQRDGVNYKVAVLSFGQAGAPASRRAAVVSLGTAHRDHHDRSGHPERPQRQSGVQVERAIGRICRSRPGTRTCAGAGSSCRATSTCRRSRRRRRMRSASPISAGRIRTSATSANIDSIGDSWFNGLTLSSGTRDAAWGSARVSYTLSRSVDTSATRSSARRRTTSTSPPRRGPRTTISGIGSW